MKAMALEAEDRKREEKIRYAKQLEDQIRMEAQREEQMEAQRRE